MNIAYYIDEHIRQGKRAPPTKDMCESAFTTLYYAALCESIYMSLRGELTTRHLNVEHATHTARHTEKNLIFIYRAPEWKIILFTTNVWSRNDVSPSTMRVIAALNDTKKKNSLWELPPICMLCYGRIAQKPPRTFVGWRRDGRGYSPPNHPFKRHDYDLNLLTKHPS